MKMNKSDLEKTVTEEFLKTYPNLESYIFDSMGNDSDGVDTYISSDKSKFKVQIVELIAYHKENGIDKKSESHKAINSNLKNLKNTVVTKIQNPAGEIFDLGGKSDAIQSIDDKIIASLIFTIKHKLPPKYFSPGKDSILLIHLGFTPFVDMALTWLNFHESHLTFTKEQIDFNNEYDKGVFLVVKNQENNQISSYRIIFENKSLTTDI